MLTSTMTIGEIFSAPALAPIQKHLISSSQPFFTLEDMKLTLKEYQDKKQPTWFHEDILYGLRHLCHTAKYINSICYPIYADSTLQHVTLLYLPAENRTTDTYGILLSGGAYGAVCTMAESLPAAAKLNELGIDCFCLNYRTASAENFSAGLLPAPLDDLAQAVRFIETTYQMQTRNYFVGGFSAGGHIASLWGTKHLGAYAYGIKSPLCLLLVYPLITMANQADSPIKHYLCTGMFGTDYTRQDIDTYDASSHITENYPPVYLLRCQDDPTIPQKDGDSFLHELSKNNIYFESEFGKNGGHGFGLGSITDVSGWVERAYEFIKELES